MQQKLNMHKRVATVKLGLYLTERPYMSPGHFNQKPNLLNQVTLTPLIL